MVALISEWREKQLSIISEQIQKRIYLLQSIPKVTCLNADKYLCKLPYVCGTGCELHQLMSCLMRGFYNNTLVLFNDIFRIYLNGSDQNWEHYIMPISETCQPNSMVHYKNFSRYGVEWYDGKYLTTIFIYFI